jgi:hypothetical protein
VQVPGLPLSCDIIEAEAEGEAFFTPPWLHETTTTYDNPHHHHHHHHHHHRPFIMRRSKVRPNATAFSNEKHDLFS